MNDDLLKKAETVFYYLTKEAARTSFNDFLSFCDCTDDEWELIKNEITSKTKIKFNYL